MVKYKPKDEESATLKKSHGTGVFSNVYFYFYVRFIILASLLCGSKEITFGGNISLL